MRREDGERDEFAEDWFEDEQPAPEGFHDPEGETWLEPTDYDDEGPHDRRTLVAGIAAAVVLVLIVVGLVRVLGGDDAELSSTLPTTPTATEPAGTGETEGGPVEPAVTLPEDVTLTLGDENDDVALLQEALIALGYDAGEPDGLFGAATEEAVQQFQADSGLEADGIAGPETLAAMNEALASGG